MDWLHSVLWLSHLLLAAWIWYVRKVVQSTVAVHSKHM